MPTTIIIITDPTPDGLTAAETDGFSQCKTTPYEQAFNAIEAAENEGLRVQVINA